MIFVKNLVLYLCPVQRDKINSLKSMSKTNTRNNQRALIVEIIAERRGLKPNTIRKVLTGDRNNEDVMEDYVDLSLKINALKKEVVNLVPFHPITNN